MTDTPEGTGTKMSVEDRFATLFGAPPEEEATPDTETEEPVEAAPEEEPEAEAEGVEEAEEADEPEDEPTYTVKVAGEELQVPLSELLAGYSRTGDYKRKTQEVADQRREVAAERETVTQLRDQYAAALPQLRQLIEQSIGPEPDPTAFDNRADYLFAKDQYNTAKAQIQAVSAEQERIRADQQREQEQRLAAFVQSQAEALAKKLPEWSDPQVKQREQSEIADYLRAEGFTDQELAHLYDHRAIVLARKAMLYDQLQATGRTKVKAAKPKTKAAVPGAGQIDTRGRDWRQQRDRLKQTGSPLDAAPLFQRAFTK